MKRILLAAVTLALLSLPAHADPIITPLVSSALLGAGVVEGAGITIFSTTITYASLASFKLSSEPAR